MPGGYHSIPTGVSFAEPVAARRPHLLVPHVQLFIVASTEHKRRHYCRCVCPLETVYDPMEHVLVFAKKHPLSIQ